MSHSYLPALSYDWLTPLYDPLIRYLFRERTLKQHLIAQAEIRPGHAVLDVGCGTGTLAMMVKQACPGARVVGLDADPRILGIARGKIDKAGLDIELVEGMAYEPPLPAHSFDRVLSTLVFHHLSVEQKRQCLAGMRELLRPKGELHVADFGKPHNPLMQLATVPLRFHDAADRMGMHLRGELPDLIKQAGFVGVREPEPAMTLFGTFSYVAAVNPES